MILLALWGFLFSAANSRAWLVVLLLLGIAVVAVWLARRFSAGPKTPRARDLTARLEMAQAINGPRSEAFVADVFRAMGHRATMLGGRGDQGVNAIVE